MKRHDTHLLSDESEKKSKEEEDAHQYNFNNSSSESNNSNNNNISKESNKKTPLKLILENNNVKKNNESIISSSELADIFRGEVDAPNQKYKKKKKSKAKKKNFFVKLKKVRLNKENGDNLIEYNLTYNPSPNYSSLIDSQFINIKQDKIKDEKYKSINKEKDINKLQFNTEQVNQGINNKNKNINNKPEEKEILYFFYKDDNEGDKKLKRVINIINKEKSQLYKISNKNCFTLRNTNNNLCSKSSQKISENPFSDNYNGNNIERFNKKRERMNYPVKNKLIFKKTNNSSMKENRKNDNLNLSLQNQNRLSYYKQSMSNNNNFKNSKEQILYELYNGKNDNNNINLNKKQRIKSTDSLFYKKKMLIQNMNNTNNINYNNNNFSNNNINNKNKYIFMEREEFYPEYIRFMEIHNREKENRKIIKNMFRRAGANCYDFSRHVGNDANCPICQMIQMKNENNIRIKGIRPIISSANNSTQNSWQNRRIYSALSRILTRRQIDRSGSRTNNMSHTLNINKSLKNTNLNNISKIINKKYNSNFINNNQKENNNAFRKLNINKSAINQGKFPKTNKVISFRNNNIKYN